MHATTREQDRIAPGHTLGDRARDRRRTPARGSVLQPGRRRAPEPDEAQRREEAERREVMAHVTECPNCWVMVDAPETVSPLW